MVNKQEIEFIKINNVNQAVGKNKLYCLKLPNENSFSLIVTDLNGVRVPLKDLQGSNGINSILNTDGNLVIAGNLINLEPSLVTLIDSALQPEQEVVGEGLLGNIDGINATFNILNTLLPDSERVYINGNRQKKPDDYNISGQTIIFTFSPQPTESILIDYIKI